ncbi:MAG: two-component regulator propeller domain-containing protein [Cyclobacteriaceae bacterium]|jgi:ligand-binding sensor domain-containing protein
MKQRQTIVIGDSKLIVLLLFLPTICLAQQSVISARESFRSDTHAQGHFYFKNFFTEDGLPLDAFEFSYIDRRGNLWLGTTGAGVTRYDGKRFQNISTLHGLANDVVTSIFEDRDGNFWFGTYDGISRYDGKSITNFAENEGLEFKTVKSISEDKNGHLWFGTVNGVTHYDGQGFTNPDLNHSLISREINASVVDTKGNIWFGSSSGLSRYDGTSLMNYAKAQGLETDKIMALFEDNEGNLWIGGYEGGVTRFDGLSFKTFTKKDGLAHNSVWSIAQDHEGIMWFATSKGLSSYDGSRFANYTTENGLPTDELASLSVDRDGNLWIAAYNGGGVSLLSGKETTNFTPLDQPLLSQVRAIAEDRRTRDLWIGTEGGLVRYDGRSFKKFSQDDGLPSNVILTLTKGRDDILWIGTLDGGLCKFDGKNFVTVSDRDGLISNDIDAIYEDKKEALWISYTEPGLSRYDGKRIHNFSSDSGLPWEEVSCITEDVSGDLWVGTNGGGVSCLKGEKFITYADAQGLPSNSVLSILADGYGHLWVGTHRGLSRFDGKTFLNFSLGKEWGKNVIQELAFTAKGELVMGTNVGLFVLSNLVSKTDRGKTISADNTLSNKELSAYTPVFDLFNSSTGFQIGAISGVGANALIVGQDGAIWAATRNVQSGLVRFDLNAVRKNDREPEVAIQHVSPGEDFFSWYSLRSNSSVDSAIRAYQEIFSHGEVLPDKERTALQKRMSGVSFTDITPFNSLPVNLTLPYAHNQLKFEFKVVGIAANSEISYQYILEGEEKEWSTWTNNNTATYKNLHEGNYTFTVRARNKQTNSVSRNNVSFSFLILPPWYRTWWAYAGYLFIFIFSFVFGILWNSRRLRAINLKLEAAVQNRTEEITAQNEELVAQQEEISSQRDQLEKQNQILEESKRVIAQHNQYLETAVRQRTLQLANSNEELKKQFRQLEQFSFIAAHNLRAPVARILGLANIFSIMGPTHSGNVEVLGRIVQSAQDLDTIVQDLGTIVNARPGAALQREPIAIPELVTKITSRFAREIEEYNVFVETDLQVEELNSVPAYIDSILSNLLSNSIRYRALERKTVIKIAVVPMDGGVTIRVDDNGIGFDATKYADKLFQPFQRFHTHVEGKGLGMYLIKTQVEALGGQIEVTSVLAEGTSVQISLPNTNY